MDESEKRFEQDIETFLLSPQGGYVKIEKKSFDLDKCISMDTLCQFIETTQPKAWEKYQRYYGDTAQEKLYSRLEKCIREQGLIHVLRHGIEDLGVKLKICYFKPETSLNDLDNEHYQANIVGCTRQFRYSPNHNNTIDIVLSVNGIPIVAMELKNQLTGQDYHNAIEQYRNDRSSKEFCFSLDHRFLVYFAVDLYEVWMTTELKDKETYFIPFNQGNNGGAGNPEGTNYLWEEVLQKDSLLDILHRFISHVKERDEETGKIKEKLLFPRYHQYDVVRKILADVREHGAGNNYLIQHSAGSGKSNSIAWTAYRLASVHNTNDEGIFDSVIVVTNRIVLDGQLQETINSFEHKIGLVEAIDERKNSHSLAEAINDGKRIIICTIQKFLFAYKDMQKYKGRNFAIIIDEAHQGQSGDGAKMLRRSLIDIGIAVKEFAQENDIDESEVDLTDDYINEVIGQGRHQNQSFFAFTATPKAKTLEVFGTPTGEYNAEGKPIKKPFHVYSMKQAIEEGFILDVLSNYTTHKTAFRIVRTCEENPELIEGAASRALFRYYKEHGYTITQKTEIMMSNFLSNGRYQISGKGKCMVVADSRANAVRYYLAIRQYLKDHAEKSAGCNVMIAFSGEVKLDEFPDRVFTEASMNLDENGKYITTDKRFRKAFHNSMYNILVVANKYQTGFDEPLLHSMYIDKKLKDVAAVQTLSRLNRTAHGKQSTFVLDFENTDAEIKEAFQPFYQTTMLEGETDLNRVYDLRRKIAEFMLYNFEDTEKFNDFMLKQSKKKQDATAIGRLSAMFRPVIERYQDLSEEEQYTARDYIQKFNRAYAYITQLIRLHDKELFHEYLYTSHLIRLLPKNNTVMIDIDDKIRLEYADFSEMHKGAILLDEKPPMLASDNSTSSKKSTKKKDTLQSIIDKVNERFEGQFTDSDRVIIEGIYRMFMSDADIKRFQKYANDNSTEMFVQSLFPDKFKEIVTQCFIENHESFQKLFNDSEFYQKVQDAMANELYKSLRKTPTE